MRNFPLLVRSPEIELRVGWSKLQLNRRSGFILPAQFQMSLVGQKELGSTADRIRHDFQEPEEGFKGTGGQGPSIAALAPALGVIVPEMMKAAPATVPQLADEQVFPAGFRRAGGPDVWKINPRNQFRFGGPTRLQ